MLACNGTEIGKAQQRNLEQILHQIGKRLGTSRSPKYFDWLYLSNFNEMRKITRNFFAGIRFKNLVIENAPKLQQIHPGALKQVSNQLRYIYAYNTGLQHYRSTPMEAPFGALRNLTELHIASRSNICPPKGLSSLCLCVDLSWTLFSPFYRDNHSV